MLVNIGYNNMVNADKIVAIVNPDASPVRRLVQSSREEGLCIDATQGRKTQSVLVMDSGHTVLSAMVSDTIARRVSALTDTENSIIKETGE